MRTIAYIDGFNLYRRLLKPHNDTKWLNLDALVRRLLDTTNDLIAINYYTAGLSGKYDADLPVRQNAYLRALSTIPHLKIHKGLFETSETFKRLALPAIFDDYCPLGDVPTRVKVIEQKEKGSDVKLASHLIRDGFQNKYDVAVVITNDSDIAEPVRIVTQEIGKNVGILIPDKKGATQLIKYATFCRHIDLADVRACQFPDYITDKIRKPILWK